MIFSPISIFVYNRPLHTKLMLNSLSNCDGIEKSKIFIFIDGPKNTEDRIKIKEVRELVHYFKRNNKNVVISESKKNRGTYYNIVNGINTVLKKFDKIIVIEDDLRFKQNFLTYMNKALKKYQKNKNVLQISGYSYPIKINRCESYFLNLTSCWGWGIWKDRWDDFNKFLSSESKIRSDYQKIKNNKLLKNKFNINNSYDYLYFLKKQIVQNFNSWGILFYLYSFSNNKLNLFPSKSLIENNGFDGSGLHRSKSDVFNLKTKSKKIKHKFTNKIYNSDKNLEKISIFLKTELSIFNKIKNIFN